MKTHSNYHLVTAVPPVICKTVYCMHQAKPSKGAYFQTRLPTFGSLGATAA